MKTPTWVLAVVFAAISLACGVMILRSTGRLAFDSPEDQRRFWAERYLAQLPRPDKTTMLNIYRYRPEAELVESFAMQDMQKVTMAREVLWNLWMQDLGPDNESRHAEAVLMHQDGLTSQALALAKVLARRAPDHAEPHALLGRLYFHVGNYPKGLAECRKALERNPLHWPSLQIIAANALAGKDFAVAREALEKLREMFPHDSGIERQINSLEQLGGQGESEEVGWERPAQAEFFTRNAA